MPIFYFTLKIKLFYKHKLNMKQTLISLFLLFFLSHLLYAQKKEEKLVKKSFDCYKAAILNDKGEEAVKYVDSRTIKYYSDILEHVKNADSAKLETLSTLDKVIVFSVRHRTSKEDILSFDGKDLLISAIKNGMVGKSGVVNNSIGKVNIDKNFATGEFVANGVKTPFVFNFYKENKQWKFDLTSLFSLSNDTFKQMIEESGENENEYIFSILEMITGKKPGNEIFYPIK